MFKKRQMSRNKEPLMRSGTSSMSRPYVNSDVWKRSGLPPCERELEGVVAKCLNGRYNARPIDKRSERIGEKERDAKTPRSVPSYGAATAARSCVLTGDGLRM
jgi:hypothetical protein